MDGILVPCRWNEEVFRACGVRTRIEVLPHISQFCGRTPAEPPSPDLERLFSRLEDRFVFYCVGEWSERKAPWKTLDAFWAEFAGEDRAVLVLKTGEKDYATYKRRWDRPWMFRPGRASEAFEKAVKGRAGRSGIIHITDGLSDNDMAWLHRRGDCFVSLTRGEGWGMGAYEAAWWGKPVIITGFGGQLDYLPADLSYHVDYKMTPVRRVRGWESYTEDQLWAEPDLAHARSLMRLVFQDLPAAREKGAKLREYVGSHFAPYSIARRLMGYLGCG
jgi:glycosyltransferase involved in cell wall biosynthesis